MVERRIGLVGAELERDVACEGTGALVVAMNRLSRKQDTTNDGEGNESISLEAEERRQLNVDKSHAGSGKSDNRTQQ